MTQAQRSDARRNRQLLLDAASEAFATNGVTTSLEAIADRAGVSIGTLYNHFGDRDGLVEAVLVDALGQMCVVADTAAALDDPWQAFENLIVGTCELQAVNRAVADILGNRYRATGEIHESCDHLMDRFVETISRAQAAGRLRSDFVPDDLGPIMWSVARVAEASETADAWRRHLGYVLDGLRQQPH